MRKSHRSGSNRQPALYKPIEKSPVNTEHAPTLRLADESSVPFSRCNRIASKLTRLTDDQLDSVESVIDALLAKGDEG
jgi:hypothetical protein